MRDDSQLIIIYENGEEREIRKRKCIQMCTQCITEILCVKCNI